MTSRTPRAGAWHHATPRTWMYGARGTCRHRPGRARDGHPGRPRAAHVVPPPGRGGRQKSVEDVVLVDVVVTEEAVELDEVDVLVVLVVVVTQSTAASS